MEEKGREIVCAVKMLSNICKSEKWTHSSTTWLVQQPVSVGLENALSADGKLTSKLRKMDLREYTDGRGKH